MAIARGPSIEKQIDFYVLFCFDGCWAVFVDLMACPRHGVCYECDVPCFFYQVFFNICRGLAFAFAFAYLRTVLRT